MEKIIYYGNPQEGDFHSPKNFTKFMEKYTGAELLAVDSFLPFGEYFDRLVYYLRCNDVILLYFSPDTENKRFNKGIALYGFFGSISDVERKIGIGASKFNRLKKDKAELEKKLEEMDISQLEINLSSPHSKPHSPNNTQPHLQIILM